MTPTALLTATATATPTLLPTPLPFAASPAAPAIAQLVEVTGALSVTQVGMALLGVLVMWAALRLLWLLITRATS